MLSLPVPRHYNVVPRDRSSKSSQFLMCLLCPGNFSNNPYLSCGKTGRDFLFGRGRGKASTLVTVDQNLEGPS